MSQARIKRVIAICGSKTPAEEYAPYAAALQAAGLEAALLRPREAAGVSEFDGLCLMGGSDVNPARYGISPDARSQPPDDDRDETELRLISIALERDLPVLAICRGLQILNVQHGGTLIQHLNDDLGHRVKTPDKAKPAHEVGIEPGTKLQAIFGDPPVLAVNSRHHQAADRIGHGLEVSARSKDGIVEGLERNDKRFVVAVQWHPENQAPSDARQAGLFAAFARAI